MITNYYLLQTAAAGKPSFEAETGEDSRGLRSHAGFPRCPHAGIVQERVGQNHQAVHSEENG